MGLLGMERLPAFLPETRSSTMKSGWVWLAVVLIIGVVGFVVMNRGDSTNVTVATGEITVHMKDLDVCFTRDDRFSSTYMLFGGDHMTDKRMIIPLFISGVDAEDGKDIAVQYPDFWMCKSPGASRAQSCCMQLNLVPSNADITEDIKDTIANFKESLGDEEDRVCIKLQGDILRLKSVIFVEQNEDITSQLARQFESMDCRFITRAEQVGWKQVLSGAY
jgi:hypothetical protein